MNHDEDCLRCFAGALVGVPAQHERWRQDNAALDALWESQCIESAEILMAEGLGIEGRGEFFDSAGTIRDTVQNHVLQLLTALAMETRRPILPRP